MKIYCSVYINFSKRELNVLLSIIVINEKKLYEKQKRIRK